MLWRRGILAGREVLNSEACSEKGRKHGAPAALCSPERWNRATVRRCGFAMQISGL